MLCENAVTILHLCFLFFFQYILYDLVKKFGEINFISGAIIEFHEQLTSASDLI